MEEREKIEKVKNLNKFQIAAARRAYANEKMSIRQLRKVEAKLTKWAEEKSTLESVIEDFDAPIKKFTGGIGAEETLRILGILKDEEASTNEEQSECPAVEAMQEVPVTTEEATKEMPEWMKVAEEELK